jgi:hypothetical protein
MDTPNTKEHAARRSAGKSQGKTQGNLNGQRGKAWERKLAKATGGIRTPMSGGGHTKGDVLTRFTLVEAKTSARLDTAGGKVFNLKREWLTKAAKEAAEERKLFWFLALHFFGDTDDFAVLPMKEFQQMLAQLEGLYTLAEWLDKNPTVAALLPVIDMPALGMPLYTVPAEEGDAYP